MRDTRISVALLLAWLAAGMTIGEIVKEYPSLSQVKIFLDENMPESLAGALKDLGHEVDSVNNLKLKGIDNGTLYRQVAV